MIYIYDTKNIWLEKLMEDLDKGSKIIVACNSVNYITQMNKKLFDKGIKHLIVIGSNKEKLLG